MSIIVNKDSKVLVQGFTGSEGTFHSEQMIEYGTNVVCGVTPGKGGSTHLNKPVYNSVQEAVINEDINTSIIFVPPAFAADAIMEAAESGIKTIVAITPYTEIIEGYLVKQARRLHPTKRLLVLAAGLTQHAAGQTARHQILQNIARETGETVNFVRPEIKGMFYADRVETDWPFRVLLPVGTHVPFHCTASGKTYLASLPAAKRRTMLAGLDLHQYTETTHTSAA